MKNNILVALIFLFALFLLSCTKETISDQEMDRMVGEVENVQSLNENMEEEVKLPTITIPMKVAGEPEKLYEMYYKESPDSAYSVEDWIGEDGSLSFPPDLEGDKSRRMLSESFTRFYIPREALEVALTSNLLNLSQQWPMARYNLYNFPSYYLQYLITGFNGADELMGRTDLAEVLLEEYAQAEFLSAKVFDLKEEQNAYNLECYQRENAIVLMELLLGTNKVFEQMDDNMRQKTLDAAMTKMKDRQREAYNYLGTSSGFYAHISELHDTTGSSWYDYIKEIQMDTELINYLDEFWIHSNWPNYDRLNSFTRDK